MKKQNASLMAVAAVLALIAFVAPSSAYSIEYNSLTCDDPEIGKTTWAFTVSRDSGEKGISHWVVFWCNKDAVEGVWVDNGGGYVPHKWEYKTAEKPDPTTGYQGIKIDYTDSEGSLTLVKVKIILNGNYCEDTSLKVPYVIKYSTSQYKEFMEGPLAGGACTDPIPEFRTIAIPIASILGLLFFFNRRKRREK